MHNRPITHRCDENPKFKDIASNLALKRLLPNGIPYHEGAYCQQLRKRRGRNDVFRNPQGESHDDENFIPRYKSSVGLPPDL